MMTLSSSPSPRRALRRQGGFTLVEIITVLAIIGMLIGVVVKNTDKLFGDSQAATARIYVRDTVSLPLTQYRMDMYNYPSTNEGLNALVAAPTTNPERWRGPYLEAPGGKLPLDPWGEPYQYRFPGTKNPSKYDVYSKGPDKTADTGDDIGNW